MAADLTRLLCDPDRLAPWLDAQGLVPGRPLAVERITTGHSNETFLVRRDDAEWILRRPPRGPLAPPAHDMVREARRLPALAPTAVPAPRLASAAARLASHRPPGEPPALIPGDYHLDNVMFAPALPPGVIAILDWETATIGDPLIDVGLATALWPDPDDEDLPMGDSVRGFGSRAALAARYARVSGRSLTHLPYYQALGLFRLACILEGSWARHVRGAADDPYFAAL